MYNRIAFHCAIIASILVSITADPIDTTPIPPDAAQVQSWFQTNVKPLADRKAAVNASLVAANEKPITIKVRQDGSGNFKTLTEAIASIPTGNSQRVIVDIGPGKYVEKLTIDASKPFVTFYGAPDKMPTLSFNGDAQKFGTVFSATVTVESDFFVATNIIFENSSPQPDGKRPGAQAVAARVWGDKASFYNCKFLGFQDTLCDDRGRHFFKDCYIEGTVDFIFGSGKSIYLTTELNVLPGGAVITAQARNNDHEDTGFAFLHCKVTGEATGAYLGRPWMEKPRVVFAYSEMGKVVHSEGWSLFNKLDRSNTVQFGEYKCMGPGANPNGRAKFLKQLSDAEAQPYLSLGFIEASSWLLPPPTL